MKNSKLVYVKVRLWISCAADVQEVTSEMDYRFNHVDIIDTEIVDVIEPEKPPTWVFKDLSSADEGE